MHRVCEHRGSMSHYTMWTHLTHYSAAEAAMVVTVASEELAYLLSQSLTQQAAQQATFTPYSMARRTYCSRCSLSSGQASHIPIYIPTILLVIAMLHSSCLIFQFHNRLLPSVTLYHQSFAILYGLFSQ